MEEPLDIVITLDCGNWLFTQMNRSRNFQVLLNSLSCQRAAFFCRGCKTETCEVYVVTFKAHVFVWQLYTSQEVATFSKVTLS